MKTVDLSNDVLIMVFSLIICCLATFVITKSMTENSMRTKYLKSTIIAPTDAWIALHGDNLESWQTFNANILVQTVREQQKGIINAPVE